MGALLFLLSDEISLKRSKTIMQPASRIDECVYGLQGYSQRVWLIIRLAEKKLLEHAVRRFLLTLRNENRAQIHSGVRYVVRTFQGACARIEKRAKSFCRVSIPVCDVRAQSLLELARIVRIRRLGQYRTQDGARADATTQRCTLKRSTT